MAAVLAGVTSPVVSAIVSVYKAERFIQGCLEDLVSQTLFQQGQLEIVIVNSNSPENEEPIIRPFQQRFPDQIRYIRTPKRETIYQAWNRAVQVACGRYITNANADDRHRHDALEIMANKLSSRPDIALVYANSDVTPQENALFETAERIGCLKWPAFDPVNLFRTCYIGPQPMWRRDLHEKYGYFDPDYRSAGDYEFWLRLAVAGMRFLHIEDQLGLYLMNPDGMENSNLELSALESQKARLAHWPQAWGECPQPGGEGYFLQTVSTQQSALSNPLVSIVVHTRNRPDFLCRSLQSILEQTYPTIEILVVNDGGVDVQELITCLDTNGMIRYFNLPKTVERSAARNLALRQARGHYIAYLDDDDRYYPNHVATLVNQLQKTGSQVAYTVARRVTADVVDGAVQVTEADIPFALDYNPQRLLIENYIPILCLMHERSLLEKSGLFDEKLTRLADWELWIRFSQQTHFEYIPAVTCEFTRHAGDSTGTPANAAHFLASCKEIFRRYAHLVYHRQELLQWQQTVLYRKTCGLYDALLALVESYLGSGDSPKLEQFFRDCLHSGITVTQLQSALALALARQQQGEQALELLQRALLADNNNFRAREALADGFIKLKQYPEAVQQLEILLAENPGDAELSRILNLLAQHN